MSPLLLPAMFTGCVLAGVWGWWMIRTGVPVDRLEPDPVVRRRTAAPGGSRIDRLAERVGQPMLAPLVRLRGSGWIEATRRRLAAAGEPSRASADRYLARKLGTGVVGTLAALVLALRGHPWLAIGFAVLSWAAVDLWLRSKIQRRQADIQQELPDFLDVLSVTLAAGLSFRAAVGRVGDTLGGALGQEIRSTLNAIDLGITRRTALQGLRERNPSRTLRRFVTAVLNSEELGTPIAGVVATQAHEMRRERAREARRRAGRADPQVTVIAALFFLPGAAILLLTAFALVMFRDTASLFGR